MTAVQPHGSTPAAAADRHSRSPASAPPVTAGAFLVGVTGAFWTASLQALNRDGASIPANDARGACPS
jgi:hypothetical protein